MSFECHLFFYFSNFNFHPKLKRSDVWSFGCIMLEIATCSLLDQSGISDLLFEMKQVSTVIKMSIFQ